MKTTTMVETAAAVVSEMYAANGRRNAVWIREACLAIEERMGRECDIADIHAALQRVAVMSPCDDPRRPELARQLPFGLYLPGAESAPRVLLYPR